MLETRQPRLSPSQLCVRVACHLLSGKMPFINPKDFVGAADLMNHWQVTPLPLDG